MKTSTIPSIRVEPELRDEIEQVLSPGESLSAFVDGSVRESLRRRQEQAEFLQRGLASLEAARRSGRYVPASTVVQKLERRVAVAKATAGQRRKPRAAR
jgi:predicted transcriptional regulator